MINTKVKELLSQLRGAANALRAQIHDLDDKIAILTDQRRALTDTPVSKADLMEYVRADIQRRAANYKWRLEKLAREGNFLPSFAQLESRHTEGKQQPFPYLDGNPQHDNFMHIESQGIFWNFGELIAERFSIALDKFDFVADSVPVVDRRRMITEIDAKLNELNAKRDELVNDLISSGMNE